MGPSEAKYVSWLYPFAADWERLEDDERRKLPNDPDAALVSLGGFVYFDKDCKVVHVLSAMPTAGAGPDNLPFSEAHDHKQQHGHTGAMRFGKVTRLSEAQISALISSGALNPVRVRDLLNKGA